MKSIISYVSKVCRMDKEFSNTGSHNYIYHNSKINLKTIPIGRKEACFFFGFIGLLGIEPLTSGLQAIFLYGTILNKI